MTDLPLVLPLQSSSRRGEWRKLAHLVTMAVCGMTIASSHAQAQTDPPATYTTGYHPHARSEAPGDLIYRSPTPLLGGRLTNIIYHDGWLMTGFEGPGSDSKANDLRFRVMDVSRLAETNLANALLANEEGTPVPVLGDGTPALQPFWPSDFGLDYGTNDRGREHWYTGSWGYHTHGHGRTKNSVHSAALHTNNFGGAVYKDFHPDERINWGWNGERLEGRLRRNLPWMGSQDWAYGDDRPGQFFGKAWLDNPNGSYNANNYTAKQLGKTPDGSFGVRGFPALMGDRFFIISDQRRSGVAIYQATDELLENWDPEAEVPEMSLRGLNKAPFGGYWPEFYGRNGRLYIVAASTDNIQVMDVTDSNNPVLVRDWEPSVNGVPYQFGNATYPKFQDNLFMSSGLVVNMDLLIAGNPEPAVLVLDSPTTGTFSPSQYSMPLGNLIVTGGYGRDTGGMTIHVRQQAPDTTAPQVAFHVPEVNRTGYSRHMPVSVLIHEEIDNRTLNNGENFMIRQVIDDAGNETLGDPVDCLISLGSDNLLMITPVQPLLADASYQVDFPETNGIMDISGNRIEPYSWRFSTGNSIAANNDPAPTISGFLDNSSRVATNETATITATIADNAAFEYRFDPGDGSGFGNWVAVAAGSATLTLDHTYNEPGRFTAQLQLRDDQSTYTTQALSLIVLDAPTGPAPTENSPIIIAADGTIWAVNPDADTVTAIDGEDGSKIGEYPVGDDPRNIAQDANGFLWVSCMKSDELYILNSSGESMGTAVEAIVLDYGDAPFGVVASPDGGTIYVTAYGGGGLYQFNINQRTTPNYVNLGPTPRAIAVNSNHSKIFVTRFISKEYLGQVWRVNASNRSVKTIDIHIVTDADGNNSGAGVPNYLAGIAISPQGQYAVITGKKDNTFRGPVFGSEAPTHENSVRAMLATIDITNDTLVADSYHDIDNSDSPTGIRFSPYGDILFVALQGNNEVIALDGLEVGVPRSATRILHQKSTTTGDGTGGRAPQGLAISATSNRIYTQNFMSRSVTILDASRALDNGEFVLSTISEVSKVATEGLASETIRLGKEIFYNANDPRMGAETYMSCATCHVDGGHDGRVWDFSHAGEGLRRTTDLRGRSGTDHGNVHWSGNFDEIQDFELVMRDRFLGEGFIPNAAFNPTADPGDTHSGLNAELDAMAAYVASLDSTSVPRSPHRDPDTGGMTDAALRGREQFIALNCMSCHDGARLTESRKNTLRNVGTLTALSGDRLGLPLTGIDVPTLIGLHATERYGHLGISESLEDFLMDAMGPLHEAEDVLPVFTNSNNEPVNSELLAQKTEPNDGGGSQNTNDIFGIYQNAYAKVKLANKINDGSVIRFENIDGGSGGTGYLWVRSIASPFGTASLNDFKLSATINDSENVLIEFPKRTVVPRAGIVGLVWRRAEINLLAGPNNQIEFWPGGTRDFQLDAIMVATPDDLALASAHRNIPENQVDDIVAFLRQIDGRADNLPTDYAAKSWRVSKFTATLDDPTISGWTADPDGDGTVNLLEFLQGFDPHSKESPTQQPSMRYDSESSNMAFHFTLREELGDINYRVEYSENLREWYETDALSYQILETVDGVHRLRISNDMTGLNTIFFRLTVD